MHIKKCISGFVILVLLMIIPVTVFAKEIDHEQKMVLIAIDSQSIYGQYDTTEVEKISDMETAVKINEKLFDLYGVWTAVIGIVLVLVSIFGIAAPFYMNSRIDKKIQTEIKALKKEFEKNQRENVKVSNALMLSASQDYWPSNEILKECLKEEPDNVYLHLLIGRNIFLCYEKEEHDNREYRIEELEEIQDGIEHYIFVAENSSQDSMYYYLGAVFNNSVIHELCILTGELLRYSTEKDGRPNYHKLAVRVLQTIEKVMHYDSFDDIANEDQTNVHLMNYKLLNLQLAESYLFFGNIKAREQFEYTLKLFTVSSEELFEEQIEECKEALNIL